ncbi:MAG: HAMP domain-containing histidine kinase, partial [Anaerolineae bacterium]|nr:HAMP domain-containing histidine kinase [Anaerolineae bacterium]
EETDHLSELIDELLDSSRLQSGSMGMDFQPLNLNLLIQNIIERLETRYNNLEIVVEVDFAELTIHADSKRLSQVLDNLLSNAAKYAPRSTVAVSIKTDAEQVIISIADRGPGIPQEHLAHLFKRFYRVPERSAGVRGSGLGLYIADKIISAHGGNISVESQVGHGTIFNVFLPINPAPITAMSNQEVTNDHTYSGS